MRKRSLKPSKNTRGFVLSVLSAIIGIYLLVPFLVFMYSLLHGQKGSGSGVIQALSTSAITATISTALIATFGIPFAWVLSRIKSLPLKTLATILVSLPIALPPLVDGVLLLKLIGPLTFLGKLTNGSLTDSLIGIVIAQTFVASPFAILASNVAFSGVDQNLKDVFKTLGFSKTRSFLRAELPAAMPGVIAGLILAWLRAFGEFGATVLIAYHPYTLPVLIYVNFSGTGLTDTVLPTLGAILMASVFLVLSTKLSSIRFHKKTFTRINNIPKQYSKLVTTPSSGISWNLNMKRGTFELNSSLKSDVTSIAIMGETGAGKSTLLKILTGLESGVSPKSVIRLNDRFLEGLSPTNREIGYVPQNGSLIPRRPLYKQLLNEPSFTQIDNWINLLNIEDLLNKTPEELSGGQYKKVVLARALSREVDLLVLDEPFSSLDPLSKNDFRCSLQAALNLKSTVTVITTHNIEEVTQFVQFLMILKDGKVSEFGQIEDVIKHPSNTYSAQLVGFTNIHDGTVISENLIKSNGVTVKVPNINPKAKDVNWGFWQGAVENISINGNSHYLDQYDDVNIFAGQATKIETTPYGYKVLVQIGRSLSLSIFVKNYVQLNDKITFMLDRNLISVWEKPRLDS